MDQRGQGCIPEDACGVDRVLEHRSSRPAGGESKDFRSLVRRRYPPLSLSSERALSKHSPYQTSEV